jgi:hypothetical protein
MPALDPDARSRPDPAGTAGTRPPAGTERERAYDSFVVRLWHEAGRGRLQRAEVEHVQSGRVTRGSGVALAWVLRCMRTCLARGVTDHAARPGRDDEDE